MSLTIVKAGVLDTVQDYGRAGYAKWGINNNGAMDQFAMSAANALTGNEIRTAVIEMHFPAPTILFSAETLISLTGGDFAASINGHAVPMWKSIEVPAGSVLTFSRKQKGMRCYLSVHGGLDLPEWLGSASTNLKARMGGLNGSVIKKGDQISVRRGSVSSHIGKELRVFPWTVNTREIYNDQQPVMITRGNEWEWLDEQSRSVLLTASLSIDSSSDRMASFLIHPKLKLENRKQLLSSAVTLGTIQALPSGKLCVLMADHQTTGGYPRIGHVITAHMPKLAQLSPGETFLFQETSVEESEKMLFSLQGSIHTMANFVKEKLLQHYAID
jgi:antagonist of KipI